MVRTRRAPRSLVAAACVAALSGCGEQVTEVWLVVETNLPTEGRPGATSPALRQVQIQGRIHQTGASFWDVPYDLRSGRYALPAHTVFRPESEGESRQVSARVTGQLDDGSAVSQEALFSFQRGHRLYVRMFLARECIGAAQLACEMRGQTCGEGGRCIDVERRNLPDYPPAADASVDASSGTCAPAGMVATTATIDAPRLAWPATGSLATTRSPTVRWSLPAGVSGARVEFCRDRACGAVIAAFEADGDRVRPSCELPAGTVFFRVRGRQGGAYGSQTSAVWQVRIPRALPPDALADTAHGADSDFDGDGLADVALAVTVGASSELQVYRGRRGSTPDPTAARIPSAMGGYEQAVVVGDVNGDGFVDLAGANTTANRVTMHYGSASGLGAASTTLSGAGEAFGTSVGGGDLTGDGYGDVVVGAPFGVGMSMGRVLVFAGATDGLGTTAVNTFSGTTRLGVRGIAVASGGDVNGDGRHDFALGASGEGTSAGGIVEVRSGAMVSTADLGRIGGPASNDGLARTIVLGDFNGDGLADLLLAPRGMGTGYVYLVPGAARLTGMATAVRTNATVRSTGFGEAMASAGDVDDDGYNDALVGEGGYPMPTAVLGQVTLFHGSRGGLVRPERVTGDSAMGTHILAETGAVGDVDGDGRPDVVLVESSAAAVRVLLYRRGTLTSPEVLATLSPTAVVHVARAN